MALTGWRHIKGTHRYRDPSGRNVSEYQYRNAKARSLGWKSYWDYRKTSASREFLAEEREAMYEQKLTKSEIRGPESTFAKKYIQRRQAQKTHPPNENAADGPLADYLVYIGRRDPDWDFDVGQTDDMRKAGAI